MTAILPRNPTNIVLIGQLIRCVTSNEEIIKILTAIVKKAKPRTFLNP